MQYSSDSRGLSATEVGRMASGRGKVSFRFHKFSTDKPPSVQLRTVHTLSFHALVFQLKGETHLNWGEFRDVVIGEGEMYFLPHGAEVSSYIVGDVSVIVAMIDRDITIKQLDELRKVRSFEAFDKYEFAPLKMNSQMLRFAESISDYLRFGVNCANFHEAKSSELYVIFRWYYSMAENAQLFHPMAGEMSEFRYFILDNFTTTISIEALAQKANMSRSTFERKFKETFSTTPQKWIEEHTRQLIITKAGEPNVSVKDIMYEVGIYNPSQFTKFCKRVCGVTPSELIRSK